MFYLAAGDEDVDGVLWEFASGTLLEARAQLAAEVPRGEAVYRRLPILRALAPVLARAGADGAVTPSRRPRQPRSYDPTWC
jgi:hypothetical protein